MGSQNFEPIYFSKEGGNIDDKKSPLVGALFLFLLFVFAFLFVYFLYVCTYRSRLSAAGLSTNQNGPPPWTINRSAVGLDPAAVSALPIFSYESSVYYNNYNKSSQEAECSICLSMFQEGDKVKVLPRCRHGFHSQCVDKWLRACSTCPLCRASILLVDSNLATLEIP